MSMELLLLNCRHGRDPRRSSVQQREKDIHHGKPPETRHTTPVPQTTERLWTTVLLNSSTRATTSFWKEVHREY